MTLGKYLTFTLTLQLPNTTTYIDFKPLGPLQSIEQSVTDYFDHMTTFYHGDLARLDRDCPPITLNELTKTIGHLNKKIPQPTKITSIQLKKNTSPYI